MESTQREKETYIAVINLFPTALQSFERGVYFTERRHVVQPAELVPGLFG